MPVSVAYNIEILTHELSGITIIFIPDKEPKYWTTRLKSGHLATLNYYGAVTQPKAHKATMGRPKQMENHFYLKHQ